DGTMYCVHRYFFFRDSIYFSTRFSQLGIRDHEALPTIISIGNVERNDFEALLSVLYPANFEEHELTYEQWKSVLHLSTRWGFVSLRKLALKSIKPPTSHDKFILARTYSVNHWVLPALTALCERTLPLSLDEARQMSPEDVILVARVREEIRGGAVRVDAVDILVHVVRAQLRKIEGKAYLEALAKAEEHDPETEARAKAETRSFTTRRGNAGQSRHVREAQTCNTYPSHLQMSPITSEVRALPEFGPEHTSPHTSEGRKRLLVRGGHATPDDSFIRHDVYFFKDGNITFLVDGTLYCVHRYFFSRDSVYFSTRFTRLGVCDHEALPTIISIGDVERNDFEALLSILYPANFEARELTYEQWKSVLHLSTRWGFASLRKLALNSIRPPTSHDQLVLARTYSVDHWVLPALTALCKRTLPLSLDEARQMKMEDVVLVARVREEIRGGALRDPIPTSTSTPAPVDATPAPPVPEKDPAPEKDATVTKERAPTAEPAASVSSEPNGEPEAPNAPHADAEKASEILAQSETPLATQGNGEKPDGGDDAKPEGLVKPALRLDRFREVSTASAVSASGPGTPVDEVPLSSFEQEDDGGASGAKLTKNQKKRLRDRARKQAQGDETNTSQKKTKQKRQKNTSHPPSGEPPKSVGDSVVQEPRPVATAPVDIPVWEQGVLVDDGNVTFLIDGTLYCVHRYFFSRDSAYFSTRFAQLGIRDHEALPTIISLGNIDRNDFEALLSILYPASFEAHELTYEQWKSVLHLSTRWGFASLRKLSLESIKPPTPHDKLVLARTYSINHWVLPALTALCERTLPLSLDEALQMSMEDVILVARVREEIRGGAVRV
ncbi:hypothetical protein EDB84DRAFT_1252487, partial [Lactarius hengduanensis]